MYQTVLAGGFEDEVKQLRNVPRGDEILLGLIWAASRNPDDFPVLEATTKLHLAKSENVEIRPKRFAQVYLWFSKLDENRIELLTVEIVPIPIFPYMM